MDLFIACKSQWQPLIASERGVWWRGAQWVNVAQAMTFMAVPTADQPALWQQYRTMEVEALAILQERADKAANQK